MTPGTPLSCCSAGLGDASHLELGAPLSKGRRWDHCRGSLAPVHLLSHDTVVCPGRHMCCAQLDQGPEADPLPFQNAGKTHCFLLEPLLSCHLCSSHWPVTEGETVAWPHQLNGHECEQSLRDSEGQGSLVCCKESDTA